MEIAPLRETLEEFTLSKETLGLLSLGFLGLLGLRKMGIDTNEAIFNFFDILTKYRIISLLVQCPKKQTFYEV